MSLSYRLKRLVKSDMHALVEGFEDPKWVLAQALRDMEEEIEKIEADLGVRRQHLGKIRDRLIANQAVLSALENDIEFAMQEKREDIAKNLIRKLLVTRKNVEDLTAKEKASAEERGGDSSLTHQVEIEFLRRLQNQKEATHEKQN